MDELSMDETLKPSLASSEGRRFPRGSNGKHRGILGGATTSGASAHDPVATTINGSLTSDPMVRFENVTVTYGSEESLTNALSETTLDVPKGDFLALVGPSGCGKSTLLRIAGELLKPTTGHLFLRGREAGAENVRMGMAYQSANLLPWLTIRENIMLLLKIVRPYREDFRRKKNGEYRDRVDGLLEQVGLLHFAEKYPWQLSGGMLQRANLCRAIVHEPELLLLDEPFGALDQFTKEALWKVLQSLWSETGVTIIMVTHDLREAAFLANRICVMSARPGRILEDRTVPFARPRVLNDTYSSEFVSLTQHLRNLIVDVYESPLERSVTADPSSQTKAEGPSA